MQADLIVTLTDFFETLLGTVPPEFSGFVYLFFVMFLFYIVDQFFMLLKSIFGVTRWKR